MSLRKIEDVTELPERFDCSIDEMIEHRETIEDRLRKIKKLLDAGVPQKKYEELTAARNSLRVAHNVLQHVERIAMR